MDPCSETIVTLRATSRMITAAIRRIKQQQRRERIRSEARLPRFHQLVICAMARQTEDPLGPAMVYVLQHCSRFLCVASDQPRRAEVEDLVSKQLLAAGHHGTDLDAVPEERTPAVSRAWKTAAKHLADMELAKWTARCNTEQRIAPTTAQVQSEWASLKRSFDCSDQDEGTPESRRRARRRLLQRWRSTWGFRYGKMALRDRFGDGELLSKAPRAPRRHKKTNT